MDDFNHSRKCSKCGSGDINTQFHRAMYFSQQCTWGSNAKSSAEHMHRSCRRCGYDWLEVPLDNSPSPAAGEAAV